jgi:hypothetical protein
VTVVASLDAVEGEVYVCSPSGRARARVGQAIQAGEGIECAGPRSAALVVFADRTRIELAPGTLLGELSERDAAKGRRLFVEKGSVKAEVSRQPPGLPMLVATPHGEARILGTTFALHVDRDPKRGTRLEVEEGKVELRNGAGRTALVEAGHTAVAATAGAMLVRPLPKEELILALTFDDGKRSALAPSSSVERGPGGRICLVGDPDVRGTSHVGITDDERGLFSVRGDEVLSFDYWVDSQAASVNFNFWNRTQMHNYWADVPKLVTGKWSHAAFRLAELGDAGARMKEGDWIGNLIFQASGSPPRHFYLDNIMITRARVLKPRAVETKK